MLFSIIIPVYNRATVVRRTLASVAAQTHRPLQLVLVDNDSQDNTLDVLREFKQRHESGDFEVCVAREARHTAGAARNRGLEHARGEWLLFFDSDDEMSPTLVEGYAGVIARLRTQPDLVVTGSLLLFPDGSQRPTPLFRRDLLANQVLHSLLATQRYAVRRDFFMSTTGWDETLPGWNDWELGIRLLLLRPRVGFLAGNPRVTVYHNGADSITGTEFHSRSGQWERAINLAREAIAGASLRMGERERLLRLVEFRRLSLAAQYEREGHPELADPLRRDAHDALRASYGDSRRWRWWVAPATRRLYHRMTAGKRGAARVARRLF